MLDELPKVPLRFIISAIELEFCPNSVDQCFFFFFFVIESARSTLSILSQFRNTIEVDQLKKCASFPVLIFLFTLNLKHYGC